MEGGVVRVVGLITLLLSGLILVLLVGALVSPWYVLGFWLETQDETASAAIYQHPFLVYTSCSGDGCTEDSGLSSWSEICEVGCAAQLALYNILWVSRDSY